MRKHLLIISIGLLMSNSVSADDSEYLEFELNTNYDNPDSVFIDKILKPKFNTSFHEKSKKLSMRQVKPNHGLNQSIELVNETLTNKITKNNDAALIDKTTTDSFSEINNRSDNLDKSIKAKSEHTVKNTNKINQEKNKADLLTSNDEVIPDDPSLYQISCFDAVAQKLAGNYCPPNSKIMESYSKFINSSWDRLYRDSLGHIPQWTQEHLQPSLNDVDTLFYPFGGPDVSYSLSFFPNVKRYILVGLEPIGNFDQIENMSKNPQFYKLVRTAFSTFLQKGYFITSEMMTHLSSSSIRGSLSLVLLALPKLGFKVLNVKNCSIDVNGDIVEANNSNIRCVRVVCTKAEVNNPSQYKEIYCVRANLDNINDKMDNLLKFVGKYKFTTFIKSASYALHDKHFTKVRSFILSNTHSILQDDTGVPFNFLSKHWKIQNFGTYTIPTLKIFHSYKQPNLTQYYQDHTAKPILFPIGYGYNKRTPNLIFAISTIKLENQIKELKQQLKKKKCNCSSD